MRGQRGDGASETKTQIGCNVHAIWLSSARESFEKSRSRESCATHTVSLTLAMCFGSFAFLIHLNFQFQSTFRATRIRRRFFAFTFIKMSDEICQTRKTFSFTLQAVRAPVGNRRTHTARTENHKFARNLFQLQHKFTIN